MNSVMQQQRNNVVHVSGFIRNFRKLKTRTGKPMAVFTLGTVPVKCFDFTVDTAECWADTGKQVRLSGKFSNHRGQIELVAEDVVPAAGQTDALTNSSQGDYSEISTPSPCPLSVTSMTLDNLSGCVNGIRRVTTHSGRPMITFKVGSTPCKGFGDLAGVIQKSEGKQIEVRARKGTFRGETEYAVEAVKTINGVPVDLQDRCPSPQGQDISKTVRSSEATNPSVEMDSEAFELYLQKQIESDSWICKAKIAPIDKQPTQPASTSDVAPLQEGLTAVSTRPDEGPRSTESEGTAPSATQSPTSAKSLLEPENLVDQWVRRFKHSASFPDHDLEERLKSGQSFIAEAARRVLEEREQQRALDRLKSLDCFCAALE